MFQFTFISFKHTHSCPLKWFCDLQINDVYQSEKHPFVEERLDLSNISSTDFPITKNNFSSPLFQALYNP